MAEELVYQIRALSTKHGDLQQKAAGLETENTALSNLLDRANFTAPRFVPGPADMRSLIVKAHGGRCRREPAGGSGGAFPITIPAAS